MRSGLVVPMSNSTSSAPMSPWEQMLVALVVVATGVAVVVWCGAWLAAALAGNLAFQGRLGDAFGAIPTLATHSAEPWARCLGSRWGRGTGSTTAHTTATCSDPLSGVQWSGPRLGSTSGFLMGWTWGASTVTRSG